MPPEVHFAWAERGQVPIEHGRHAALGIEDEVAEADIAPQQDGGTLHGHVARAPVQRLPQRRQRLALGGPRHIGKPTLDRIRELRPRQGHAKTSRLPVDGMHISHDIDELVVHDPLEGRPGIAHVRVEKRSRSRDVTHDAWHGEEGRTDPLGICHDHRRCRGRHTGRGHGVLDECLRSEDVRRERWLQRRQPHHHARVGRADFDQDGLVGLTPLGRAPGSSAAAPHRSPCRPHRRARPHAPVRARRPERPAPSAPDPPGALRRRGSHR